MKTSTCRLRRLFLVLTLPLTLGGIQAETALDVEELRIPKALEAMPESVTRLQAEIYGFLKELLTADPEQLNQLVIEQSQKLWRASVTLIQDDTTLDDRSLYWARLSMRKLLKESEVFAKLTIEQQTDLLWQLELHSRGASNVDYQDDITHKILITGFDPFFLDRHIHQSNPSGATALALDGQTIEWKGKRAQIEAVILPVRFAEFDQGMVETMLRPHIQYLDLLATISMGRSDFDLERFPGLRRSAEAPDNLNVLTGASKTNPLIPMLKGEPLDGPEFVLFSLPVEKMQRAEGAFKIIDNHKVSTLEDGAIEADSLQSLAGKTSVSGSGGGYLSNEISYRSIRLTSELKGFLPTGHIHTPRIQGFDPETTGKIIEQIRAMLTQTLD